MRKMRRYRDFLIEELADAKLRRPSPTCKSHGRIPKRRDGDALYRMLSETAVEAQGGARNLRERRIAILKTWRENKDETLIANIIAQLPATQCEEIETEKLQTVKT